MYGSGALLVVSVCVALEAGRGRRPPLGRFRLRSAILGTRSVMESLAAPSVEAMTPSTPFLPPNAPPTLPPSVPPPSPRARYAPLPLAQLFPAASPTRSARSREQRPRILSLSVSLRNRERICNPLTCTRPRHCLRVSTKTNRHTGAHAAA